MRAGRAEAREIDRFAPRQLGAHMGDPRIGEFRAELVKSRSPHGLRRQPAREAEAEASEPGMPRANSYLWWIQSLLASIVSKTGGAFCGAAKDDIIQGMSEPETRLLTADEHQLIKWM